MPKRPTPKAERIDCDDLLSKHGAGLLSDVINEWWHSRGYRTVKAERYLVVGTKAWGVRSNLVAGLPPLAVGGAAKRAEMVGT